MPGEERREHGGWQSTSVRGDHRLTRNKGSANGVCRVGRNFQPPDGTGGPADAGAKEKVILVSTILHDPAETSAQGLGAGACRLIEQIIEIRLREREAAESRQGGAVAWASGPGGPGRCCSDFHVPR
jgi:hypothetical protein